MTTAVSPLQCIIHLEGKDPFVASLDRKDPFIAESKQEKVGFWASILRSMSFETKQSHSKIKLKYTQLKLIKQEGNCLIIKVRDSIGPNNFVLKMPKGEIGSKEVSNEVNILRILNEADPEDLSHVIKINQSFIYNNLHSLLIPYYSSDLETFAKNRLYALDEEDSFLKQRVLPILRQFLEVSLFLKKCGVIHLDIKPQNILIDEETYEIKLIDFGISLLNPEETDKGTPAYKPPERLISKEHCNFPVDMWGFGCTTAQVLDFGAIPFLSRNRTKMKHIEMQQSFFGKKFVDELPTKIPPEKKQLLDKIPMNEQETFEVVFKDVLKEENQEVAVPFMGLLGKMLELNPDKRVTPEEALSLLKEIEDLDVVSSQI